jgi:hypothetical protein
LYNNGLFKIEKLVWTPDEIIRVIHHESTLTGQKFNLEELALLKESKNPEELKEIILKINKKKAEGQPNWFVTTTMSIIFNIMFDKIKAYLKSK